MDPEAADATVPRYDVPAAVIAAPTIPGYDLYTVLGSGSFGQVWKGVQVQTGQWVAVKVLLTPDVSSLLQEVSRLSSVGENPHVVHLLDANLEHQPPYLVTPLLRTSLADIPTPTVAQVATWFEQMVEALRYVHKHGILHCDIKPANVLLDGEDNVRIVDFGQATQLGQAGLSYGTLWYMPPEQARLPAAGGTPVLPDVTWDVYALGATVYHLLTGRRARTSPAAEADLAAQGNVIDRLIWYEAEAGQLALAPIRTLQPAVDGDLAAIVTRCLEVEPSRRYQSMGEVGDELRRRRERLPLRARSGSWSYVAGRFVQRNWSWLATAATCLVVLIVGVVRYIHGIDAARAAEAEARQRAQAHLAALEFEKALRQTDGTGVLWLSQAAADDPNTPRYRASASRDLLHQPRLASLWPSDGPLWSARFSPDGRLAATASDDGTVRLWDVATGQPRGTLKHPGPVFAIAFSPDGQHLAAGCFDGAVRVWNVAQATLAWPPIQHGPRVRWVAWSPDGTRLVSASDDHTACVWNSTGHCQLTVHHLDRVVFAAFSPDGKRLLTASQDRTVRQWDSQTGQPVGAVMHHRARLIAAAYSPDGRCIASAAADHTARLWSQAGEPLSPPLQHEDIVDTVSFSPDGHRLATASRDGTARVWSVPAGRPLTPPLRHRDWVWTAEWSRTGDRLVTASRDHTVRLWDPDTGLPITDPMPHPDRVACARFSPDGRRVLSAADDGVARLWNVEADLHDTVLPTSSAVTCTSLSGGGPVATGAEDGTVALWTSKLTRSMSLGSAVRVVAVSADGRLVAAGGTDGALRWWDVASGRTIQQRKLPAAVTCLAFSAGHLAAGTLSGLVVVFDLADGRQIATVRHKDAVLDVCFSPDGQWLATASLDKSARLWNASTGQPVTGPLPARDRVVLVRFSPDGHLLLAASFDKSAHLWRVPDGTEVPVHLTHHGSVLWADFSPDGSRVATAASDGTCRVWEVASGHALFQLQHDDRVNQIQYSRDGSLLATGSDDGSAEVWDANSGQPLTAPLRSSGPVSQVAFSADTQTLLTLSNGRAQLWSLLADDDEPDALLTLEASVATGFRLGPAGALVPLSAAEFAAVAQQRQSLAASHAAACRYRTANGWTLEHAGP